MKQNITDLLYYCAAQCNHCEDACRMEKDKDNLATCMAMDQDCAELCRMTGALLERGSPLASDFLRFCASICSKCAEECEKHSHMEHCRKCAEACRRCAEACENQLAENLPEDQSV